MCRRHNQTYIATSTSGTPQYISHCRNRRQQHYQQTNLIPVVALPQTLPHDNIHPGAEQIYLRPAQCKRERKGRCCKKHTPYINNYAAVQSTPTATITTTATATATAHHLSSRIVQAQQQQQRNLVLLPHSPPTLPAPIPHSPCGRRPHQGPVSGMASLVIAGIAIGAHKISERRKEKKKAQQAEAATATVTAAVVERDAHAQSQIATEKEARSVERRGRRKSEEAREEEGRNGASRGRRRSSSVYSEDGDAEAPPSYEPPSYDDAVSGGASRQRQG